MAYIYQIVNDINQKIYVGKTEFSLEKRFKEHCSDAFKERNEKRPLYSAMRKYGIEHFHIELLEETDNPEERETYWIEQLGSFKHGYNATLGGDGKKYIGYDLVVETYHKVQNAKEVAKMLSISHDSVINILKTRNERILTPQEIMKQRYARPVFMLDKETDEIIKTFSSLREAAEYLINNNLTRCKYSTIKYHISEVCRGKRKSAAGFKWSY